MKKFIIFTTLLLSFSVCFAVEPVNIKEFTGEVKNYSSEIFPELSDENWLSEVISGNLKLEGQDIIKKIGNVFFAEFRENKDLLFKIIGIALLCSILKHLQNHFEGNVSEIAFYVCYMVVIILIVTSFTSVISICQKSISKLKNFMNVIIPILITLLLTMGNISTVATIQPVILVMISTITTILSNLVIPIILISTILNLVGNISKEVKIHSISKFLKKSMLYIIEFMMILFVRNPFH